jgi:hypothetical protein
MDPAKLSWWLYEVVQYWYAAPLALILTSHGRTALGHRTTIARFVRELPTAV